MIIKNHSAVILAILIFAQSINSNEISHTNFRFPPTSTLVIDQTSKYDLLAYFNLPDLKSISIPDENIPTRYTQVTPFINPPQTEKVANSNFIAAAFSIDNTESYLLSNLGEIYIFKNPTQKPVVHSIYQTNYDSMVQNKFKSCFDIIPSITDQSKVLVVCECENKGMSKNRRNFMVLNWSIQKIKDTFGGDPSGVSTYRSKEFYVETGKDDDFLKGKKSLRQVKSGNGSYVIVDSLDEKTNKVTSIYMYMREDGSIEGDQDYKGYKSAKKVNFFPKYLEDDIYGIGQLFPNKGEITKIGYKGAEKFIIMSKISKEGDSVSFMILGVTGNSGSELQMVRLAHQSFTISQDTKDYTFLIADHENYVRVVYLTESSIKVFIFKFDEGNSSLTQRKLLEKTITHKINLQQNMARIISTRSKIAIVSPSNKEGDNSLHFLVYRLDSNSIMTFSHENTNRIEMMELLNDNTNIDDGNFILKYIDGEKGYKYNVMTIKFGTPKLICINSKVPFPPQDEPEYEISTSFIEIQTENNEKLQIPHTFVFFKNQNKSNNFTVPKEIHVHSKQIKSVEILDFKGMNPKISSNIGRIEYDAQDTFDLGLGEEEDRPEQIVPISNGLFIFNFGARQKIVRCQKGKKICTRFIRSISLEILPEPIHILTAQADYVNGSPITIFYQLKENPVYLKSIQISLPVKIVQKINIGESISHREFPLNNEMLIQPIEKNNRYINIIVSYNDENQSLSFGALGDDSYGYLGVDNVRLEASTVELTDEKLCSPTFIAQSINDELNSFRVFVKSNCLDQAKLFIYYVVITDNNQQKRIRPDAYLERTINLESHGSKPQICVSSNNLMLASLDKNGEFQVKKIPISHGNSSNYTVDLSALEINTLNAEFTTVCDSNTGLFHILIKEEGKGEIRRLSIRGETIYSPYQSIHSQGYFKEGSEIIGLMSDREQSILVIYSKSNEGEKMNEKLEVTYLQPNNPKLVVEELEVGVKEIEVKLESLQNIDPVVKKIKLFVDNEITQHNSFNIINEPMKKFMIPNLDNYTFSVDSLQLFNGVYDSVEASYPFKLEKTSYYNKKIAETNSSNKLGMVIGRDLNSVLEWNSNWISLGGQKNVHQITGLSVKKAEVLHKSDGTPLGCIVGFTYGITELILIYREISKQVALQIMEFSAENINQNNSKFTLIDDERLIFSYYERNNFRGDRVKHFLFKLENENAKLERKLEHTLRKDERIESFDIVYSNVSKRIIYSVVSTNLQINVFEAEENLTEELEVKTYQIREETSEELFENQLIKCYVQMKDLKCFLIDHSRNKSFFLKLKQKQNDFKITEESVENLIQYYPVSLDYKNKYALVKLRKIDDFEHLRNYYDKIYSQGYDNFEHIVDYEITVVYKDEKYGEICPVFLNNSSETIQYSHRLHTNVKILEDGEYLSNFGSLTSFTGLTKNIAIITYSQSSNNRFESLRNHIENSWIEFTYESDKKSTINLSGYISIMFLYDLKLKVEEFIQMAKYIEESISRNIFFKRSDELIDCVNRMENDLQKYQIMIDEYNNLLAKTEVDNKIEQSLKEEFIPIDRNERFIPIPKKNHAYIHILCYTILILMVIILGLVVIFMIVKQKSMGTLGGRKQTGSNSQIEGGNSVIGEDGDLSETEYAKLQQIIFVSELNLFDQPQFSLLHQFSINLKKSIFLFNSKNGKY